MGFRSVFTTEHTNVVWPDWFREKYSSTVRFPLGNYGPLSAECEAKTYGVWADLPDDIQKAIDWEKREQFVLVYLHECGGVTRCRIEKGAIKWTEPLTWQLTDMCTHEYCYGCSDA